MFPTSTKPENHHVLELSLVTWKHHKPSPFLLAPPPTRNCRCTAGRHSVEQLLCTASSAPCRTTSPRPRRSRPPPDTPRRRRPAAPSPVPSLAPDWHHTHATCRPRHGMATPCPHCPELPRPIKRPLLDYYHHHQHHPLPLPRLDAAEEELELHSSCSAAEAVPPRRSISGDATASLLLPRPPAVTTEPPRSPSPPAGASPAAPSLS